METSSAVTHNTRRRKRQATPRCASTRNAGLFILCLIALLSPGCSGGGCKDSAYETWKAKALAAPDAAVPGSELEKLRAAAEAAGGVSAMGGPIPTQRDKAQAKLDSAANAIGWIAGLCAIAALGTMILSFIVPFIPTKTSAGCFAACLAGYALQYALLVYGVLFAEVAIWLAVAVLLGIGGSVIVPWAIGVVNYLRARTGQRLIEEAKAKPTGINDIRAGVALIADAKALSPEERKELLAKVSPG